MQHERRPLIIGIGAVVAAAVIALVVVLRSTDPAPAVPQDASRFELTVQSADGSSTGQSIQGSDLMPAPTNEPLHTPESITSFQPTGAVEAAPQN